MDTNSLEQLASGLVIPAVFAAGVVIYDQIIRYSERKMLNMCIKSDRQAGIDPSKGSTQKLVNAFVRYYQNKWI